MKPNKLIAFLTLLIGCSITCAARTPLYKNPDVPVAKRVNDLLHRMTLPEKIGQMNQRSYWYTPEGARLFHAMVERGQVGSLMNVTDPATADSLQKTAMEKSRLGIPLLLARDVIHGYKTIFPIPLGQAATFNPDVAYTGARIAATEAASDGIRWTFAPMLDIARDARWGRIAEGCGEDPYLTSLMAAAMVRGFQHSDSVGSSTSVAACAKHFVAYGAAEGGRDYNATCVSERQLRQTYLPPFKAARDAGAMTFMASFNANDGIPSSCNGFLLKGVLRDEWDFNGFVVSDCFSVRELMAHGVAADAKEAVAECVTAGLDMDMEDNLFADNLEALVKDGQVNMEDIDRAVSGILRTKFLLGLFEDPYVRVPQSVKYAPRHLAAAEQAALESVIMLKNDNRTLPLDMTATGRILLTGPMADARYDQMGTWIFDGEKDHTVTLLDAFRSRLGDRVVYEPGLPNPRSSDVDAVERAVRAAQEADIVIAAVGEDAILSGEGHCMASLKLVGAQTQLLEKLKATGKPLVLVVMAGRPLAIGAEAGLADAVLYSFHPGTMGGPALASLITGDASPSGRCPVTFPSTSGQCPIYYNHANTGRPADGTELGLKDIPDEAGNTFLGCTSYYLDAGHLPLYPFGYGLTYGDVEYSDMKTDAGGLSKEGTVKVSACVTNKGDRKAVETVQLYSRQHSGSVTPAVADLRGFKRVSLQPGERRVVEFELPASQLAVVGLDNKAKTEPGVYTLRIGPDSTRGLTTEVVVK